MRERHLIQILSIGPLLFIPLMVASISFVVIDSEKENLTESLTRLEQERTETIKTTIQAKVHDMVDLAAYRKSIIKEELHERIQKRVENTYQIALKLRNRYAESKSEQEIKQLIIQTLRPLVWNGGESFIWILDFEGVFYLAPEYLQHLEGHSVIDFQDGEGREIIKEEIELTQTKGQGFIWDTFTKPNEDFAHRYEQLAFVKKMGFYDWYLGSSEYLESATQKTDHHLLAAIDKVGNHGSDYFFIVNRQGTLLLNHSIPEMVGHSLKSEENTQLKVVFDKIMQAINLQQEGFKSDFIDYEWLNPAVNH